MWGFERRIAGQRRGGAGTIIVPLSSWLPRLQPSYRAAWWSETKSAREISPSGRGRTFWLTGAKRTCAPKAPWYAEVAPTGGDGGRPDPTLQVRCSTALSCTGRWRRSKGPS
jgi:hypothetical protein